MRSRTSSAIFGEFVPSAGRRARSPQGHARQTAATCPTYTSLFRFGQRIELIVTILGCLSAIGCGAMTPVSSIMFGRLLNSFFAKDMEVEIQRTALTMLALAGAAFLSGTLEYACLVWAGARQTNRVRQLYLTSLLSQDMTFFDMAVSGVPGLLHALREDAGQLQEAISEKLGAFLHGLSCFIGSMAIAFSYSWDLSLVVLSTIPALILVGAICGTFTAKLQTKASQAYARAGGIAHESVAHIRTVAAFRQEEASLRKYAVALGDPSQMGEWQGLQAGFTLGSTHLVSNSANALALWYGARRVAAGKLDGGRLMSVLMSCLWGGFALGQAMPHLAVFQQGRVSATTLFNVIERKPEQDSTAATAFASLSERGQNCETLCPGAFPGQLELHRVCFAYPARPQQPIFEGLSLVFSAGKTSALVGASGCGKSTIIQLLLRLYDPSAGTILLDGRDVRSIPLDWLRSQIGFVSQTPTLFASSIMDNIALSTGASLEQVQQAAIAANAHDFIMKLPNKYDTVVGEQGNNLSGGQKQRIAIARAILLNPKILLLDEATSALDSSCEKAVQVALEKLMPGRTCITVAHRLATVVPADVIYVLRRGTLVEQGTHQELVDAGGYYASLAARQMLHSIKIPSKQVQIVASDKGRSVDTLTARGMKGTLQRLRESILHRNSVRLSVMPQRLKDKLTAQEKAEEGVNAAAAADQASWFSRLAELNRSEWNYGALGVACAAIAGLQMPAFSLALSEVLANMWDPLPENIRVGGLTWALVFLCIGCTTFLLETVQGWCFGVMGQRLATRVRVLLLQSLLHQDIAFFDRAENNSGALMSTLASDAIAVRGMVGDRLGLLVTVTACMIASYTLAFKSSWSVTLVVSSAVPLLVCANVVLARLNFGADRNGRGALVGADAVAAEAVGAIKTVAAFNMQNAYVALYNAQLALTAPGRTAISSGLGFGFSQFMLMAISALAFWYGGIEVNAGHIDFRQLLTAFFAVFYAAFGIAQAAQAFPDIVHAADATVNVFRILDHRPTSTEGATDTEVASLGPAAAVASREVGVDLHLDGEVELRRVAFAYPARPERLVLKEFSLKVPKGTSCALVGESGHGKSTILGLLERFYEPVDGQVFIDGINIKSLTLRCLRRQIAIVGQEPVVFSASIYDNLVLSTGASLEQVVAVTKAAQALEFIQGLPEGFATKLGHGRSQLSGGQLQRLAVARAMLYQPRVLLLDEPTSALDTETERALLLALDAAMEGRTTLIVAHRLSTIKRCTHIAAIYRGRVLEQGSHEELLVQNGYYKHLWEATQR